MSRQAALAKQKILPSKEANLFKELLTLYETRQLKKGLKTADQILKKVPEHGETLCMKGLLLVHMGKREEGVDLVRTGIRLDLTSHICWHVFGLIQKGEKNYEEALKSYTQALRFDKENMNILRDAAQLQTQLRLYDSLVETRFTILRLRPNVRQNWTAYAVAQHLNGNLAEAKRVLVQYQKLIKSTPEYDFEQSESLLYQIRIMEELGEYQEALALLNEKAQSREILDPTAILELRARLSSHIETEDAEGAWRAIIRHNPDCYDYYRGYLSYKGFNLTDSNPEVAEILQQFSTDLPKATAPRRLALNVSTGDTFHKLVHAYIHVGLKKGIPSLFADLKSLYSDPSKKQTIEDIVESALTEYSPSNQASTSSSVESLDPTTYLWTLYYLAQHYSHLGQYAKALPLIDEAISHTPTLPELYTCKARLLKRAGDHIGAAQNLDEARQLDGQDRFLNTKCGKYLLRAGYVEEASLVFGLFTKKDAASPGADLEEMQSLLYLLEAGDAEYRAGRLNLALKKYAAIQKLFNELEDDQYDFHGYALRKFTIHSYISMLKWEDKLRSHPAYIQAALAAARIFISVFDNPSLAKSSTEGELTEAEKKAKKKAKKQGHKTQEDPKKSTLQGSTNEDKGLEVPAPKDEDPDGSKLLASPDPLDKAAKFLAPLVSLAPGNSEVWLVGYDVAIRRKKLLQAVRALNHAREIDPQNPELHVRLLHFAQTASSLPQQPPSPIGPVFQSSLHTFIPEGVSLETYNSQYLQKHSQSAKAILAVATVQKNLGAPIADVEETVWSSLREGEGEEVEGFDVKVAQSFISFLSSLPSSRTAEYREACSKRFELSTIFKSETEYKTLRDSVVWVTSRKGLNLGEGGKSQGNGVLEDLEEGGF
ncbi:hypothetical protein AX16_010338 [Volvariella volvacea WC 439]|nr:hypothetical protein AX16_010338 [Volvariella volvacea WC 439]